MPERPPRARHPKYEPKTRRQPFHQEEPKSDWLDRLARLDLHFGRFARDAAGVILLAFSAMTLLALAGASQEATLLAPWADFLSLWFG